MPETLTDVALALLAGAERHDLPSLTREELISLDVAPEHQRDRQWREQLTEREIDLLGVAGLRSLVAHHLVEVVDGVITPRDELLVVVSALTSPSWLLLLGDKDHDPQILFRGLPGTGHCVIAVWSAGIHAHTLTTTAAALREASTWLRHDGPEGSERSVSTVSEDRTQQASAVVRRTAQGHVIVRSDGSISPIGSDECLTSWISAGVGDVA